MENTLKSLPYNIDAEQSVIGSMLKDNDTIPQVLEGLIDDDFYKESHKILFRAISELYQSNSLVDMITLVERLKSEDKLEGVGGISHITEIQSSTLLTTNLASHIKIISDKSTLRKLIRVSNEIIEKSYSNQNDVEGVLDLAGQRIFNIAEKSASSDFESISTVLARGLDEIERICQSEGVVSGVPSGFPDLDDMTAGFKSGEMILIAARPSMGKTTFVLNLTEHAALRAGKNVAFFSLEMSKEQLAYKLLCSEANVDMLKLRTGDLEDKDWENIAKATGPLSRAKIFIDDTAGVSVMEMRSKCRKLNMEHGIDMVVIDYLQLMSGSKGSESRQQEVSEISRSIKALAKEIECPVIALSQLSRAPEQRADHRPMLSDLRESGSIEQDADLAMFLYRDEYYDKDTEDKNIGEVIIAKQRNGPVGTVKLAWLGQYSKFAPLEVIHQE